MSAIRAHGTKTHVPRAEQHRRAGTYATPHAREAGRCCWPARRSRPVPIVCGRRTGGPGAGWLLALNQSPTSGHTAIYVTSGRSTAMKAAVVREFKQPLVIEDRPIPEPGDGQILVRIEASGLCHTDMHAANGDWPVKPTPPFVPGHEGVGIVIRAGRGVTRVKEGDRVAIPWLGWACGECEYCMTGWETLCEQQQNSGYSIDGGWAEYALASDCG